jgi:hypothetical protein
MVRTHTERTDGHGVDNDRVGVVRKYPTWPLVVLTLESLKLAVAAPSTR